MLERTVIYFFLFEQRDKVLASIYQDFFNTVELSYIDFANISNKVWKEPYNYIVIDITKNKSINGKLRNNWDRKLLKLSISKSMSIREPAWLATSRASSQISLSKV